MHVLHYTRIHDQVASYGICKIVPPSEWNPPCQITFENSKKFPTKHQFIHKLQEGKGFDDGKNYNLTQYKAMADNFFYKWCKKHHPDKIDYKDDHKLKIFNDKDVHDDSIYCDKCKKDLCEKFSNSSMIQPMIQPIMPSLVLG